jgi:hypothetical protein
MTPPENMPQLAPPKLQARIHPYPGAVTILPETGKQQTGRRQTAL